MRPTSLVLAAALLTATVGAQLRAAEAAQGKTMTPVQPASISMVVIAARPGTASPTGFGVMRPAAATKGG